MVEVPAAARSSQHAAPGAHPGPRFQGQLIQRQQVQSDRSITQCDRGGGAIWNPWSPAGPGQGPQSVAAGWVLSR